MNLFDFFKRKNISHYNHQSSTDPMTPTPATANGQTTHPIVLLDATGLSLLLFEKHLK